MSQPDIGNLANCVEDVRLAGLEQEQIPPDPTDFHPLRGRLQAIRARFSPLYQQTAFDPYVTKIDALGENQFNQILIQDPDRERAGGLMLDIAQALLQRGEKFEARSLGAFEEVVSDLYDGFLSAEDRRGVNPPDNEVNPPLVKFGNPSFGPYTWPADATQSFGLRVAIVSLPPANARRGLLAWAALGHEDCGHDILHADNGLLSEVSDAVRSALASDNSTSGLAAYWADRIDETASDVCGILNMGPAPAIGLIGFFRGLDAAFGGEGKLRSSGPESDVHPADVVRGYLAASTVRLLEFSGARDWAEIIEGETDNDVGVIRLAGKKVDVKVAKKSAELVARAIVTHPMSSLENHSFGDIQNWRDVDEEIVRTLRISLTTANPVPADLPTQIYAAHMVAGATIAALEKQADIAMLFQRMMELLKSKHDNNPIFGPLLVRHSGNITRDRAYVRCAQPAEKPDDGGGGGGAPSSRGKHKP